MAATSCAGNSDDYRLVDLLYWLYCSGRNRFWGDIFSTQVGLQSVVKNCVHLKQFLLEEFPGLFVKYLVTL
jgi:hypothetical protein